MDIAPIVRAADSVNTYNQRVLGVRISSPLPLLEALVERQGLFYIYNLVVYGTSSNW